MKKVLYIIILLSVIFTGCQNEEENFEKFQVQVTSEIKDLNYSEFQVKIIDSNTKEEFSVSPNKEGIAEFNLPNGASNYDVVVKSSKNDILYGEKKNIAFKAYSPVNVTINSTNKKEDYEGLVLNELYFNGANNGGYDYTYYEQYFTITNNNRTRNINVEGLSFGICGDYNNTGISSRNRMRSMLPSKLALSQVYTIPRGNYVLEPGKSLVIALWAKNHKGSNKPNSIDLSGADLEIYVPHRYCMTEDTEVPNVNVNFSTFEAFHWQATGSSPLVLFKIDGDIDEYVSSHKKKFYNPASRTVRQDFVLIPTNSIIDGVETGSKGTFYRKVLPNTVDGTKFKIPGSGMLGTGYEGHFIKRKRNYNGTFEDTNKSGRDFILQTGKQKSYPKYSRFLD